MFFSLFSPPRSPTAIRGARIRAEEELRFTARCILNICVSLEEYPLVRYYLPSHHKPLGPFAPPHDTRAPPPAAGSGRWRTTLARGDTGRAEAEAESAYLPKVLAYMVQQELDEYKKATPEFPVSSHLRYGACLLTRTRNRSRRDHVGCCSSPIEPWILLRHSCMNSPIRPCATTCCPLITARNTGE